MDTQVKKMTDEEIIDQTHFYVVGFSDGSKVCLEAEEVWKQLKTDATVVVNVVEINKLEDPIWQAKMPTDAPIWLSPFATPVGNRN